MQTIEIKQNGNVYSCDIGISKDEWLEVLKSKDVSDSCKETLMKFFYSPRHRGTCKAVANAMGGNPQSLRSHITAVGQYVQNRLNRFQVLRPNGNPCYWIIPMSEGTDLPEGSEGVFEWQLRPELVEAIKEYLYWYLVECYKNVRKNIPIKGPEWDEGYKWELITDCQGKGLLEIVSRVSKTNLIDMVRDKTVINYMVDNNPEAYRDVLKNLCKEELPLDDRLTTFKQSMKAIVPDYINNKKIASKANDERTAASILSCNNPSAYTFYKYDLYKHLCKYLGISKKPKGLCYSHYLSLLHPLMMMATKDKELQEIVSPYLAGKRKSDLLLAQDVLWILMVQFPSKIGFFNSLLRPTNQRVWLWGGNENTIEMTTLRCGSSAKTIKDFREFKSKAALKKAYQEDVGKKDNSIPGAYWSFVKEVKEDDYVVVFNTHTADNGKQYHLLYGWGRITSDCLFDEDDDNPMARTVEWNLPFLTKPVKDESMGYNLFFQSTTETQARRIKELLNIETENKMEQKHIDLIGQLEANKNVILTGAPGTGKTYLAKQIAAMMIFGEYVDIEHLSDEQKAILKERTAFVQFHPSYDYTDFVEGLRPVEENGNVSFERRNGVFKDFCARALAHYDTSDFDSAYDKLLEEISDGLQKLKTPQGTEFGVSVNSRGNLKLHTSAELNQNGVLTRDNLKSLYAGNSVYKYWKCYYDGVLDYLKDKYHLCQTANEPNKKYFFIIDEINRGEISKIFGELFFSIDPGYRGEAGLVETQYQNMIEDGDVFKNGFFVPNNVYIIGTMNDIDRSVESMDFAMRRRFAWEEVTAVDSMGMLDKLALPQDTIQRIKCRMSNLNDAIAKTVGLNEAFQIGAAYFKKYTLYNDFDKLWNKHLKGLLAEYLRGNRDAKEQLSKMYKAYCKETIADEDGTPDNNG